MAMRKYGTAANNNVQGVVVANQDETELQVKADKKSEKKKD